MHPTLTPCSIILLLNFVSNVSQPVKCAFPQQETSILINCNKWLPITCAPNKKYLVIASFTSNIVKTQEMAVQFQSSPAHSNATSFK